MIHYFMVSLVEDAGRGLTGYPESAALIRLHAGGGCQVCLLVFTPMTLGRLGFLLPVPLHRLTSRHGNWLPRSKACKRAPSRESVHSLLSALISHHSWCVHSIEIVFCSKEVSSSSWWGTVSAFTALFSECGKDLLSSSLEPAKWSWEWFLLPCGHGTFSQDCSPAGNLIAALWLTWS